MSNTTKNDYLGEEVPTDATLLPAVPEPEQDQQEQLPGQDPKHDHSHDDGDLAPMCVGGGCVQKTSV